MCSCQLKTVTFIYLIFQSLIVAESIPSITLIPTRCNSVEPPSTGTIILSVSGGIYSEPLNCSITLTAISPSHRLLFGFNTGHGETGMVHSSNETSCGGVSIQLFDGPNISSSPLTSQICGNLTSTERLSSGDTLTLLVLSMGIDGTILNFTAHYTSFTKDADCGRDFRCSNGRCISNEMLCDSSLIDNCGDFSDNSRGPPANCSDQMTTTPAAEVIVETTSTPPQETGTGVTLYVAATAGGAASVYFLHWLLLRPGWLVWRLGCLRHTRCCRKCWNGNSGSNSVDAAKPMASEIDSIKAAKHGPNSAGPPKSDYSGSQMLRVEISHSPFVEGIKRQKHIFSLDS